MTALRVRLIRFPIWLPDKPLAHSRLRSASSSTVQKRCCCPIPVMAFSAISKGHSKLTSSYISLHPIVPGYLTFGDLLDLGFGGVPWDTLPAKPFLDRMD